MVRLDAPEVFAAIESANPYSSGVRRRFFELASALNDELAGSTMDSSKGENKALIVTTARAQ
jgi:hypothetical protein